jgi:hypothetical protein
MRRWYDQMNVHKVMTMEESREPQQAATGPIAHPTLYSPPQNPYFAPAPPIKVSRWTRLRRMSRLLLRRLLRGTMVVGRVLRPYAAFIVVVVALLGVIGWMSYLLWGPKAVTPAFQRADSLPPTSAVETFIKGQQNFNADMMWDAYSTDYQANQLANGASKATLQARVNSERNMGLQYVHYDYIGGVSLDNGSMYFYSVDLALQDQHARFPIIFKADADGKIVGIDSPLNRTGPSSPSQ